jgi:polysaccharide biosynthesis transport protein
MELKQFFQLMRRWLWLVILCMLLAGAAGYQASRMQRPVYQAATRALVMRAPQENSSDLSYIGDQQLLQTYIQLLNTKPVRNGAAERLGYKIDQDQVMVQQARDTQIMEVVVEDSNPQHAADIANVLVAVLIEQNEALRSGRYTSTEESLQAQVAQVEAQIETLQKQVDQISTKDFQDQLDEVQAQIQPLQEEVATLQRDIAALEPAWSTERKSQIAEKQSRINQIQPLLNMYQQIYSNLVLLGKPVDAGGNNSRLAQLQSTLDLYQNLYINLLSSLETVRLARLQNTPNIVQIEEASMPEKPIRPRTLMNTALAAFIGLMLAAGTIFMVEYMDDTLKTPDEVEGALGVPVLGFVAEMQYRNKSAEDVYVSRQPRSPVSEAFRSLRTNLEFSSVQKPIRTIIVTSPSPAEGKTTIAVNLAAIYALSGKRVALVDADMRHPCVHRLLGLPNRDGLSSLFRTGESVHTVCRTKLELPHLMVLTSGSLPPNPAELLGSERMSQILDELGKLVDIVVIDTPPSLVADAQILSAKVDAVLLVVQPGKTQKETARSSMELYKRAGARVIGTVVNRIPRNREYYYGGYKYYSPYGADKGNYDQQEEDSLKKTVTETTSKVVEQSPAPSLLTKVTGTYPASDESSHPDLPKK